MQGKIYTEDSLEGSLLLRTVLQRISFSTSDRQDQRFGSTQTYYRLGQGAFRVMVTDAYRRQCAISGERTLPVLEAAHIIPYSQNGTHEVNNGLLIRKDIHVLLDEGYLTVSPSYNIEVSKRLFDDYGNGKVYYQYHGLLLPNLPAKESERPSKVALQWHNENIFK